MLVLTLTPSGEASVVADGMLCLLCGERGAANLARNVVLFLPLGAALALLLGPGRWAFIAVLSATLGVEALQFHIPGRNPLLADVLANSAGGGVGILLVRWAPFWVRPPVRRGAVLSLVLAGAASAVLLVTAFLFAEDLPRSGYRAVWTPPVAHMERYDGTVLAASVGDLPTGAWGAGASHVVRESLLAGGPVSIELEAGPRPPALAPVFSIYDDEWREILLVGVVREDLVARVRYRANRFQFDRPDLRLEGGLRGSSPGDTLRVRLHLRGGESCLALNGRTECRVGPRAEEGWALLLFPDGAPSWFRRGLDFGWMAGLLLPFGFFIRRHPLSLVGGVLLGVTVTAGWWLASVAPPSLPGLLGAGTGALLGSGLAWLAGRASRPLS